MHGRKLILNEVGKKKKINYRFNFNCAQAYEKVFFVFLVLVVTILVSNSALSYKLHFLKFECPILLKSTLLNSDPAVSA